MKYNNYLVRTRKDGFTLSRGHVFDYEGRTIDGLAIVRLATAPLEFKGIYSIIDIASGLFIITGTNKKKLLKLYEMKLKNANIENTILKARDSKLYIDRVLELNEEKKNWRKSGYEVV